MTILSLDTSGRVAVVAVSTAAPDSIILFARAGSRPRAHAEELGVLVRDALECGRPTNVVVGRGPGSFTGLRVGLGFGQVLAWALAAPVRGICSLDVVARAAGLRDGWVVLDARRGELYARSYRAGRPDAAPVVLSRDAARDAVGGAVVAGDTHLLGDPDRRARGTTDLDAAALARCAADAVAGGGSADIGPLYLRRPDVTLSAALPRDAS